METRLCLSKGIAEADFAEEMSRMIMSKWTKSKMTMSRTQARVQVSF